MEPETEKERATRQIDEYRRIIHRLRKDESFEVSTCGYDEDGTLTPTGAFNCVEDREIALNLATMLQLKIGALSRIVNS